MKESDFNTLIAHSLDVACKIPDPKANEATSTVKRPFDGFGAYKQVPVYWEAKLKKKMEAFNLQDIRDHQIENLCTYKTMVPSAFCCIILGVIDGRDKRSLKIYVFDDVFEIKRRRDNKENFKKEELLKLPYKQLINNRFDLF